MTYYIIYIYFFSDDQLCYKSKGPLRKVVTTIEEAAKVLWLYHSQPMLGGHSGLNNTRIKLSMYYHWKGIVEDVTQYVSYLFLLRYKLYFLLIKSKLHVGAFLKVLACAPGAYESLYVGWGHFSCPPPLKK